MVDTLKGRNKSFNPQKIYYASMRIWRRTLGIRWSNLRQTTPISRVFGLDRGQAIDRYYIEAFLQHYNSEQQ
jgi:hypothetical protein